MLVLSQKNSKTFEVFKDIETGITFILQTKTSKQQRQQQFL
jgi:hypothetical protein